ncbi:MAG TPA: hypothetical protein PLB10_06215 [Thiolinea sp.]|nr:hypothetical protein [Thiolinea sp.]
MTELVFYYRRKNYTNPAVHVLDTTIQLYGGHRLTEQFDEFMIDAYVLTDDTRSRVIAIDFDNTITADVDFYLNLIDAYRKADWNPVICTLRENSNNDLEEIQSRLYDTGLKVYTTDGLPKQAYMQARGLSVNLWIDDYFPAIGPCGCPLLLNNGINL